MNYMKTLVLLAALSGLLIGAAHLLGGPGAALIALGIACLLNVGAYFFSDKIVLMQYGAREVTEADAPVLYRVTRTNAQKMGMPMPKVCIAPDPSPNAFATGRSPSHAAVCATEGILALLDPDELEAVMAHEMSHVRNRDTLIMTVAGVIASAISFLGHMAFWFGGRRDDREEGGGNPIAGLVVALLAPFAAMIVQLAISRSRETGADRSAAFLTGDPRALERALQKIHQGARQVPMDATPATAHLMIAPAMGEEGWLTGLFRTHPSLETRIAALEEIESELHGSRKFHRPA